MSYLKKLNPLLPAIMILCLMCTPKNNDGARADKDTSADLITGYWQLREVNNGVVYRAHFDRDDRLYQYFEDNTGYARKRYGAWKVDGDTLHISERQGEYKLIISALTDSLMLLIKQDSMTMTFDRISADSLPDPFRQRAKTR